MGYSQGPNPDHDPFPEKSPYLFDVSRALLDYSTVGLPAAQIVADTRLAVPMSIASLKLYPRATLKMCSWKGLPYL